MTTALRPKHSESEDKYRERWKWDRVTWGCHAVDCYPGGCPWRVYSRDGKIVREEQSGSFPTIEPGIPDMNPMGCQKGAAWSQQHYNEERVLYPMKRVGERGEGKWERISWDQALSEIADGILDAVEDQGPASLYHIGTPGEGGLQQIMWNFFSAQMGFQVTDLQAEINDFSPGIYTTFGKFDPAPGMDDFFKSELILIWHANPVYTNITWYHFVQEARYNGSDVVTIAPDVNPSAIHADVHVPIAIGTDAAFANAMSQVILSEGLADLDFVQEQTDLPLLVRMDDRRFLRGSDLDGGDEDQFYWLDASSGDVAPAPKGTLARGEVQPALEGSARRHAGERAGGRGAPGDGAAARDARPRLHAGADRDALRHPSGDHAHAGAQGRRQAHPLPDGLELRQVLPRRPDGARDEPAPGSHGELGQARHRAAQLGRGPQRRNVHRDDEAGRGPRERRGHADAARLLRQVADGAGSHAHRRDGDLHGRADDEPRCWACSRRRPSSGTTTVATGKCGTGRCTTTPA